MKDSTQLNYIADMLLETAVLYLDQEAVVYHETKNGLEVSEQYEELRNKIYDIIDNYLNE